MTPEPQAALRLVHAHAGGWSDVPIAKPEHLAIGEKRVIVLFEDDLWFVPEKLHHAETDEWCGNGAAMVQFSQRKTNSARPCLFHLGFMTGERMCKEQEASRQRHKRQNGGDSCWREVRPTGTESFMEPR